MLKISHKYKTISQIRVINVKNISRKSTQICKIMIHRGEVVEQAVRKSGVSITKVAQKLGKSRRWMYLMFENPNIDLDTIYKIGRIIHYDFNDELSSIGHLLSDSKSPVYGEKENTENYWREKYYALLEEHNKLLMKWK